MSIVCAVVGHKRVHTKTWHDGLDWHADCARCGTSLIRDWETKAWRELMALDYVKFRHDKAA